MGKGGLWGEGKEMLPRSLVYLHVMHGHLFKGIDRRQTQPNIRRQRETRIPDATLAYLAKP